MGANPLEPRIYAELRSLAAGYLRGERPGHTLQPTALVHEAFLRLGSLSGCAESPARFKALAARTMRNVLVDHARRRAAAKRGGERQRVTLDEGLAFLARGELDVLALHEALERFAALDERAARVVELRFFGGLTEPEAAEALGVSLRTVEGDWRMARAWLREALEGEECT
jgi:RNA polymerase sigma factor (TIGR02999 family)